MKKQGKNRLWSLRREKLTGLQKILRALFGSIVFNCAHLCYGLKRGGKRDLLDAALNRLEEQAARHVGEDRQVWEKVGLPVIYGSLAVAEKGYETAYRHYAPIVDKVRCIGGSDSQNALFLQTFLKTLIGSKRYADAKAFWQFLMKDKPPSLIEKKWLAECSLHI